MDGKIVYKDGREEILKYGITEIPEKAYYQNKEIVRVVLPSSVKRIGAYAFMECGLISVLFSNSLISIGKGAFSCARSLESIVIPDSVTTIGDLAFYTCTSLKSIKLSKNIKIIGKEVFSCDKNLENIEIPSGVTKIDDWAFDHCLAMQNVKIPDSVVLIGYGAFDDCPKLKETHYDGTEEQWGQVSISSWNDDLLKANIYFNCSRKNESEAQALAEELAKVDSLTQAQAEAKAKAEAEAQARAEAKAKAEAELKVFAEASIKDEEDARKAAEARALSDRKLKEARIAAEKRAEAEEKAKIEAEERAEKAVNARIEAEEKAEIAEKERIEAEALLVQFLEELAKGKGEELLEKLEPVNFETKNVPLAVQALLNGKIIYENGEEEDIPHNKSEIAAYEYARKDVKAVILPGRVTSIGSDAFYRCKNLISIEIPSSVKSIGDGAFAACDNLKEVYYNGTSQEWESVTIGEDNKKLNGGWGRATVHYNCK